MSSTTAPRPREYYRDEHYGVRSWLASWLLTRDHKRIGLLYLVTINIFFIIGGLAATVVRAELVTPGADLVTPEWYNRIFTAHGIIMIFFFLIPSIPTTLGNFLLPLMIGAKDLAFPRLNLLSWYIFVLAGLFAIFSLVTGGIDTGWTFYPPYSTQYALEGVISMGLAIFISGFSSILTGLNFIVTIHKMRAPGMTWFKMPLFVWAHYATSLIQVLGTPVLALGLIALLVERTFRVGLFDPELGGDPVLFQHIFWFYSHPAVYIMILPAQGVVSELVACFSRRRIFGYSFVAFSSLAIATFGFLVWGHHMFTSSQSAFAGAVFALLSFLVAVPSGVKVLNWTATLYQGRIYYHTPMLYALGFIGLFVLGGLTGLFLAATAVDVHLHDTYFVVAHFHYIMVGGSVMGYLGGLHFWWPKLTGRMYSEIWGRISALTIFAGFNLTFFPQFILGYLGMPRRYATYPEEFQVLHVLSSAGASILAIGFAIPVIYLLLSLRAGPSAPDNPWGATGLEWQTSSPPPTENFLTTPVVAEAPYAYRPEEPDEFMPQGRWADMGQRPDGGEGPPPAPRGRDSSPL